MDRCRLVSLRGDWGNVGTWEPDPQRYPKGLREVADHVHAGGMKIVVWFEPERVTAGTWLAENHPEWVLGGENGGLLNLGNPAARTWLTEHVDKMITEQGIDLYRQDFNMDPLGFWRDNDPPDRQGITEIRHIEGYLAYWDELRRRHPDMLIDTCASGGRRNDLETLRRAVPLLRSDYRFEPVGTQGPHLWHGALDSLLRHGRVGRQRLRRPQPLVALVGNRTQRDPGEGPDWSNYRRMIAELRHVAPYFSGDYYPLTPYSLDDTAWMAWQFDRPDLGEGVVQAFRRAGSYYESARFGSADWKAAPDTSSSIWTLGDHGRRAGTTGRAGVGDFARRAGQARAFCSIRKSRLKRSEEPIPFSSFSGRTSRPVSWDRFPRPAIKLRKS